MRIFGLILITSLLSFSYSLNLRAQWDPQISQYWRTKTLFNPSFSAEHDTLQASVLYRLQWVGVKHAPKTFIGSADMPLHFLGRKHGVGIVAMTESVGLFKNTIVGGQYVYKKTWKKNRTLNIGLQAGYASIGFDASGINTADQTELEGLINGAESQSARFDGNIGVSWITPKYYVGLSATHLFEPSFDVDDNFTSYISRTYYLTGGYNIKIRHSLFELQPSFLIKTDATVFQYEITARAVYSKLFNGGISWRKDDGFVFLLGLNVLGFDAGYAYDLSTSAMSQVSKGTHEFFLRYTIPMKKKHKGQFSHKSIRIL